MKYTYEGVRTDEIKVFHYRVFDQSNKIIAICYTEEYADLVCTAMNTQMAGYHDVDQYYKESQT